jgi:hypothetical protein
VSNRGDTGLFTIDPAALIVLHAAIGEAIEEARR